MVRFLVGFGVFLDYSVSRGSTSSVAPRSLARASDLVGRLIVLGDLGPSSSLLPSHGRSGRHLCLD